MIDIYKTNDSNMIKAKVDSYRLTGTGTYNKSEMTVTG
jgi:hypothetical protein